MREEVAREVDQILLRDQRTLDELDKILDFLAPTAPTLDAIEVAKHHVRTLRINRQPVLPQPPHPWREGFDS